MNILFISELSNLGGGETSLLNLIAEFNKNFNEINPILMCLNEGKLTEESREEGIETLTYDFKNDIKKKKFISFFKKIFHIIKKNKIKVIQTNEWKTAVLLSIINKLFFLRCKVIWVCHGQWYKFDYFKTKIINFFVDEIIVVSKSVNVNLINNGINFNKIRNIPLGINLDKFNNNDKFKIRKELHLLEHETIFAVIGRFQEIKGQKLLIEASKQLLEEGKKFKVLFVGDSIFNDAKDDQYKKDCLKMIEDFKIEEHCLILGNRRDIGDILSGIDSLIIPSINESFGMVVIEAFAAGCTVITTPCDGPKELISNSSLGIVLSERTIQCLKESMEDILNNKVDLIEMSKKQKERSKIYSINRVCKLYFNVYNSKRRKI